MISFKRRKHLNPECIGVIENATIGTIRIVKIDSVEVTPPRQAPLYFYKFKEWEEDSKKTKVKIRVQEESLPVPRKGEHWKVRIINEVRPAEIRFLEQMNSVPVSGFLRTWKNIKNWFKGIVVRSPQKSTFA